jgi:acyl dehydratase
VTLPVFALVPATPAGAGGRAEPAAHGLVYDKVTVGDELPQLQLTTDVTRIVATALASRDFEAVHHDPDEARRRGTKDIFLNILSSNGYALRLVTDWAGPEAVVTAAAVRLGVPHYAGDTLTLSGRVTATEPLDGEGRIEVQVTGVNGLGRHLSGTVTLTLPKEAS